MLDGKCLSHRPVRAWFNPLTPQARVSVSCRRVIQRLAIGRPLRLILRRLFRNLDPRALRNDLRAVKRCNHDHRSIGPCPCRETDPEVVRREAAVKQAVSSMFQNRSPLVRSDVETVDLIRTSLKHEQPLLIIRPIGRPQTSLTQLLRRAAGSPQIHRICFQSRRPKMQPCSHSSSPPDTAAPSMNSQYATLCLSPGLAAICSTPLTERKRKPKNGHLWKRRPPFGSTLRDRLQGTRRPSHTEIEWH